jgi:hypothetical protein
MDLLLHIGTLHLCSRVRGPSHTRTHHRTHANIMSPNTGDIAYAVGYGAQWDEFHDQVSAISTRLPYMTCIGNHERDFPNSGSRFNGTDSGGTCSARCGSWVACRVCSVSLAVRIVSCRWSCRVVCLRRRLVRRRQASAAWHMRCGTRCPRRAGISRGTASTTAQSTSSSCPANTTSPSVRPPRPPRSILLWNVGKPQQAHRACAVCRVPCACACAVCRVPCACVRVIGGTQWQWIEADLRNVDRTKTPWIIFSGHRPMYIDSN